MTGDPDVRVLRIIARLNVGGPTKHCLYLLDLDDEGFSTRIYCGAPPDGEEGLEHLFPPSKLIHGDHFKRDVGLVDDVLVIFQLVGLMLRYKPEIVHTHTTKAGFCGRIAASIYRGLAALGGRRFPRRIRVFHTYHGHALYGYFGPAAAVVYKWVERILCRFFSTCVITLSSSLYDDLTRRYGVVAPSRCRVIKLGVDIGRFEAAQIAAHRDTVRAELGLEPATFVVALISRLAPIKNPELFIEICRHHTQHLAAAGDRPVCFLLVGSGTEDYEARLRARVAQHGLADRVHLIGNREDIERIFAAIDLCALTSINEGTPLSFIEAFAARVPCISTAVGGVPDLLGPDGERGILVDAGAAGGAPADGEPPGAALVAAYAAAIHDLATGARCTQAMVERAYRYVQAHHSRRRLVDDVGRLYRGD